jgi:hypothetical protein
VAAWAVVSSAGSTLAQAPTATTLRAPALNHVSPDYLIKPGEARQWHAHKDKLGPALSGNPSWRSYLEFVEEKLKSFGGVGITRNAWKYDRWHTSDWPDDSKWSLSCGGKPVKVASYGAYSGSTPPEGISAQLVYYDAANPPADLDMAGKIVVFRPRMTRDMVDAIAQPDYESPAVDDSYPEPGKAVAKDIASVSSTIWAQLPQVRLFIPTLVKEKAAGCVFVFDSTFDQMAGIYSFPVPQLYDAPSLFLDRQAGAAVIADAKSGAKATLKLQAEITPSETWQLIGYLPGKHYGTPADEMILFTTHSDGPSISQDNGPLGHLAVAHYFSHFPQAERPRTLMFTIDNRHFMPGGERAFAKENWLAKNPHGTDRVVAVIGLEHLGQIEFVEDGDHLRESGRVDPSNLWVTNNQTMIDLAIRAVADNHLKGAFIRVPARPGKNGRSQGPWYGLGRLAGELGKPGFSTMGSMGVYWSTNSRLDRFDAHLFCHQIATFAQLTGDLMLADMKRLQTVPTAAPNR